jgi:hypothetical protein
MVQVSGPTGGTYQSIVFFQNRTSSVPFLVSLNAALKLSGMVYAAYALVQVSGQGALFDQANAARTVAAQIDALDLMVTGKGVVHIDVSNNSPESLHLGASDTPHMSPIIALPAVSRSAAGTPVVPLTSGSTSPATPTIAPAVPDEVALNVATTLGVTPTGRTLVAQAKVKNPLGSLFDTP